MNKEKLKQIRWFSNGVWQFQPHLYFLANLCGEKQFEEVQLLMESKKVVKVSDYFFKLEEEQSV